jgi:hypothetical protein
MLGPARYGRDEGKIHFLLTNTRKDEIIKERSPHPSRKPSGKPLSAEKSGQRGSPLERRDRRADSKRAPLIDGPSTGTGKRAASPERPTLSPHAERDHWSDVLGCIASANLQGRFEFVHSAVSRLPEGHLGRHHGRREASSIMSDLFHGL